MLNYVDSFTFDDMMLIPKYSSVNSRADVDLSVKLVKDFIVNFPVIPSNMRTITELAMARVMYQYKSMAILHRFTEFDQQLKWLEEIKSWGDATRYIGFSIGAKQEDYKNVDRLVKNGAQIICIDLAHGWSELCLTMTRYISKNYPNVLLIAGNAAESEGAKTLWIAGTDIVKCNVGGGSICLTREKTGNGVPTLSALSGARDVKYNLERQLGRKLFLMNDGGTKTPGDICKALCFADLCMAGNIFSASDETPSDFIVKGERKYKSYVGSSTHKDGAYLEGVEAMTEAKGPTLDIIRKLEEGIRSCCSYQGVRNLVDLKSDPRFVRITPAGLRESGAHDVIVLHK